MHHHRPSRTAIAVALSTLYQLSRDPRCPLNPPRSADLLGSGFGRLGGTLDVLSRAAASPLVRGIIGWGERIVLPGIFAHYILRKHIIERAVRSLMVDPRAQLVVVGAGFDTLAARIASEFPANLVVELDHPATQSAKRVFLGTLAPVASPLLIACDLSTQRPSTILHTMSRFDASAPTNFVLEGLTMYFAQRDVHALWTDLADATTGQASMLCTFMQPGPTGIAHFPRQTRLMVAWLRLVRETFAWGCPLAAINGTLSDAGWQSERLFGPAEFADLARQLAPADAGPQPIGEFIVQAIRPASLGTAANPATFT